MKKQRTSSISPFLFKDCALITRMAGVPSAMNLRELQERIRICPVDCLFHHFCEVQIRPSFDDPVYHNDIALWADRQLRDPVLAERLGVINPYTLNSLEDLRSHLLDVLDERLSEVHVIPWAQVGGEFHFLQGVTSVFSTELKAADEGELRRIVPQLSLSSIYYHFIEARRRTPERTDDFTTWLRMNPSPPVRVIEKLQWIDFYSFNLTALKQRIVDVLVSDARGVSPS